MKDDTWDMIVVVSIALITVSFGYAVIDSASGHKHTPISTPTQVGRDIPQCDKELWLRIKDGCPDED